MCLFCLSRPTPGQRVNKILDTVLAVNESRYQRIATSDLNKLIRDVAAKHPPPSKGGIRVKFFMPRKLVSRHLLLSFLSINLTGFTLPINALWRIKYGNSTPLPAHQFA
jgi:predicted GTPase